MSFSFSSKTIIHLFSYLPLNRYCHRRYLSLYDPDFSGVSCTTGWEKEIPFTRLPTRLFPSLPGHTLVWSDTESRVTGEVVGCRVEDLGSAHEILFLLLQRERGHRWTRWVTSFGGGVGGGGGRRPCQSYRNPKM